MSLAGAGGIGGRGRKNGKEILVKSATAYKNAISVGSYNKIQLKFSRGFAQNGNNGKKPKDNYNEWFDENNNIKIKPFHALNDFKAFVRSHLLDDYREQKLFNFLMDLDKNMEIFNSSTLVDFVDEFMSMERQFVSLTYKAAPKTYEFYQRFLQKLQHFNSSTTITNNSDERKVFDILYTTVLSKINALTQKEGTVIVNLGKYLQVVLSNIADSDLLRQIEHTEKEHLKYKNILDQKINVATELIQSQILPQMEIIYKDIDVEVLNLLDELIIQHHTTEGNLGDAKQAERALIDNIRTQKVFMFMSLAVGVLSIISGTGAVLGAIFGAAVSVAEQSVTKQVLEIDKLIGVTMKAYKQRYNLLKYKLIDTERSLKEFANDHSLDSVRQKTADMKRLIDEATQNGRSLSFRQLRKWQNECIEFLSKHIKIENEKPKPNKKIVDTLNKFARLYALGDVAMKKYREIKSNENRITDLHDAVQALESQLKQLEMKIDDLVTISTPELLTTKKILKDMLSDLSKNKTQIEIDIGKWKINNILTQLQNNFQNSFGEIESAPITRLLNKAKECIVLLLDIFDRCASVNDQKMFVDYITEIVRKPAYDEIQDHEWRALLVKLKHTIMKNMIAERYNNALMAFMQHKFPFAAVFLDRFDVNANDMEQLQVAAGKNVKLMIEILDLDDAEVSKDTSEVIADDITFRSSPFFTWNYSTFNTSEVIAHLFSGNEVTLPAYVTQQDSNEKNALKFKDIGLLFKIDANHSKELELHRTLENFFINMTMGANQYYQCNNDIYYCPSEVVVIYYKMKRGPNGRPVKANNVYNKIVEGPRFFLSPFTTWQITLKTELYLRSTEKQRIWDELRPFVKENIDIVLHGRGEYIRRNSTTSQKYCGSDLKKFYKSVSF